MWTSALNDADLQARELARPCVERLGALLGAQQLPQQVLEGEQDAGEERQRGEADAVVEPDDPTREQAGRELGRQDRDEHRPERESERAALEHAQGSDAHHEVQEVGEQEDGVDAAAGTTGLLRQEVGDSATHWIASPPSSGNVA